MSYHLLIILAYLVLTLAIGLFFRKRAQKNNFEFFLAGRKVSGLLLFFTMAATNFSAFTIFGFSGAGYRIGYSFYPVMGFGTGFMALSLYMIGSRIIVLSKKRNYITPSDFIQDRYGSPLLKKLFSLIMIVFTLPYLSLQAIASGKSLNSLVGTPYLAGALLITIFVILYVSLGGMRSIAWTDLIQGFMMIGFTLAAFAIIARKSGGFIGANRAVADKFPELFFRPGPDNAMGMGIWFGYMFLWFFSVPMAPQMFQRFMAAKDLKSLKNTAVLYPIITTFLFFLTVSIGVMGRVTFPELARQSSDSIFPMLLGHFLSPLLSTILLTGSIAALMSTMDSQLLTLTSMVTLDFFKIRKNKIIKEKLTVVILGCIGFLIAVRPPQTILDFISATTFNGLSVLFPSVVGGLYWKRGNKYGALSSIFVGEAMVLLSYFKILSIPGILPVVPILAATAMVYIAVSFITGADSDNNTSIVFSINSRGVWICIPFLILFLLGHDFWNWGKEPTFFLGLPLWVWYYFGLGILMSAAFMLFLRRKEQGTGHLSP